MKESLINRKTYKKVKSMDKQEMEDFLARIYHQGYQDGIRDAETVDFKTKLVQVLEQTKGIGQKTIQNVLNTLKDMEGEE